jgi:hypothetical protein
MLQHQKGQAAEGDAGPEDEADQVSVKELSAIEKRPDDEQQREPRAHEQRARGKAFEFSWWCVT